MHTHKPLAERTRALAAPSNNVYLAVACLVALVLPASARAYCRSSEDLGPNGECVPAPNAPFFFWKRLCSAYAFNENLFDQLALSETEVRDSFSTAFKTWAAVDCSGRDPFFVEQLSDTTATDKGEYLTTNPEQNESVILGIDGKIWPTMPDHSPRAIALTLIWHSKKTGEIVDWDMELNLGAGQFADCVAHSCKAGMVDLQNTITHEAGHVLGLGHSTDVNSTMAAQTVGEVDTQKRSLEADDKAGYCALLLPESPCSDDSCSCAAAISGTQSNPNPASSTSTATPKLHKVEQCQVLTPGVATSASARWLLLTAALGALRIGRRRKHREAVSA